MINIFIPKYLVWYPPLIKGQSTEQAVSDPKADEDLINVRDKLGDTAQSPSDPVKSDAVKSTVVDDLIRLYPVVNVQKKVENHHF